MCTWVRLFAGACRSSAAALQTVQVQGYRLAGQSSQLGWALLPDCQPQRALTLAFPNPPSAICCPSTATTTRSSGRAAPATCTSVRACAGLLHPAAPHASLAVAGLLPLLGSQLPACLPALMAALRCIQRGTSLLASMCCLFMLCLLAVPAPALAPSPLPEAQISVCGTCGPRGAIKPSLPSCRPGVCDGRQP